jgi:gluconolactonase
MLVERSAVLEQLWTGAIWSEGPVWLPKSQSVRWSDIHRNRILEYDARSGRTHVHREDVEFTNGRTLDRDGRVVQCSHGRRSVEYEIDGKPQTITDHWGPRRLNSPNDVVVASDGTIWFTDPPYGIVLPAEGHPGELEYGGSWVFRYDPLRAALSPVITDMHRPNGLAFSPDEKVLYVSDTVDEQQGLIRRYEADVLLGTATNGRDFVTVLPGCADGFRVDREGRVWTSSLDSVQVFSSAGEALLKIPVPEKVANLCFGGVDGHDLYITASSSLYRIRTVTVAAERPAAQTAVAEIRNSPDSSASG